jgi:hypothetical protein
MDGFIAVSYRNANDDRFIFVDCLIPGAGTAIADFAAVGERTGR